MDGAGVDKVVTFAICAGEPVDYRDTNNYIASSMEKYPDRIIGFMSLNPAKGPKNTLKVLEEGVKLGLKGVKIHPLIEKCPANDKEKVYPLMESGPRITDSFGKFVYLGSAAGLSLKSPAR